MTEKLDAIIKHEALAEAFAYAQMEFEPIVHNHEVDFTTKEGRRVQYTYADLVQVQKALFPALNRHGLSISYDIDEGDGNVSLVTLMHHAFSEAFRSVKLRMAGATDTKELAAEITYLKRYGLGLITGTGSEEDNDADRLSDNRQPPVSNKQGTAQGKSQPVEEKANSKADSQTDKLHKETPLTLRVRERGKAIGIKDMKDYLGHSSKELDTQQWFGLDKLFPTYEAIGIWLAEHIDQPLAEVMDYAANYYPGGWDKAFVEIKGIKDGTQKVDGLWAMITEWQKKTPDNDDQRELDEARSAYLVKIEGRWKTDEERAAWEATTATPLYAKWGLIELLNAMTVIEAEDLLAPKG